MKNRTKWIIKVAEGTACVAGIALAAKAVNRSIIFQRLQLKNKVVLITGGSRGFGLILARKFAACGAIVVICGRSGEALQKASAELASKAAKHLALTCDITDKQQVKQLMQKIRDEVGAIDILINNAGIISAGPAESMDQSDYEKAMATHFWGPLYLMDEVLPEMKKNKTGHIVNIASISSKVSFPHLLPYNASKFALSGLSEGLTAELKKYNIGMTTVYPGLMRTGSPPNIEVKGQHRREYLWFKIADSLPFISMDANRAAGKIIEAVKSRRQTLTLSVPAKMIRMVHGINPNITIAAFSFINFFLPGSGGGKSSQRGYESESWFSSSFLARKTDEAAKKNLER
jgi:NAD(P)-dependent dehydrogenase (short-subunit alcohol dehydrogenase family)